MMPMRWIWISPLAMAACDRTPADLKRCRALERERVHRDFRDPEPAADGKILLQFLRCDRKYEDPIVVSGLARELSRSCNMEMEPLFDALDLRLEEMFPTDPLQLADEARCGELRYRGQSLYIHPNVARYRLEHPAAPPWQP